MNKVFRILTVISIGMMISFSSCKKEKEGCMDKSASNYDEDAEKDDESCVFNGDIVFYSDSTRTRELVDDNINTPVKIIVNGEDVGSLNYYNYVKGATPNCTDSYSSTPYEEVVNYSVTIGSAEENVEVVIKDAQGNEISTHLEPVTSGGCLSVKI